MEMKKAYRVRHVQVPVRKASSVKQVQSIHTLDHVDQSPLPTALKHQVTLYLLHLDTTQYPRKLLKGLTPVKLHVQEGSTA